MTSSPFDHPRFQYISTLGSGGMGEVYLARDQIDTSLVAIKIAKNENAHPLDRERFFRELQSLASFDHPHIPQFVSSGEYLGAPFYAMEVLWGLTWNQIHGSSPISEAELRWCFPLFEQLLDTLAHLHKNRWLHRDIKPSNLFISLPNSSTVMGETPEAITKESLLRHESPILKCLDFGLIKSFDDPEKDAKEPGTPAFLAPERAQPNEPYQPASDLYSFGVTLYQTITGELPFESLTESLKRKRSPKAPHLLSENCPPTLSQYILKLLSPEPSSRFKTAIEAKAELIKAFNPFPQRRRSLNKASFLGRRRESEQIEQAIENAKGGEKTLLVLDAPEGGGKTAILDHGAWIKNQLQWDQVHLIKASYLRDGSRDQGLKSMFKILLNTKARSNKNNSLPAAFESLTSSLGLKWEWNSSPEEESKSKNPALDSEQTYTQAIDLLSPSETEPALVLLLDNFQYSDPLDQEILRRFFLTPQSTRTLILLTMSSEVHDPSLNQFLKVLKTLTISGANIVELSLNPLSDESVDQMLEEMLGHEKPPEELIKEIHAQGPTWPSQIEESIRDLWIQNRLSEDSDGSWKFINSTADAPSTEQPTFLEEFQEIEKTVLGVAHLIGSKVDPSILNQYFEEHFQMGLEETDHILSKFIQTGILTRGKSHLKFGSSHFYSSCENLIPKSEQEEAHRRLAQLYRQKAESGLRSLFFPSAAHFERAGDFDQAIEYYIQFAREACSSGNDRRGRESFDRALELNPPDEQRLDVLEQLAKVLLRLGDEEKALACLRETASSRSGSELIPLLEEESKILQRRGELDQAEKLLIKCLDLSDQTDTNFPRLHYRIGCIHFDRGDLDKTREYFQSGLTQYETLNDRAGIGTIRMGLGMVAKRSGELKSSEDHLKASIASFEGVQKYQETASALNNLAIIERIQGKSSEAIQSLRRAIELRQSLGDRLGKAMCLNNLSRALWYRGELLSALEAAEEAHSHFRDLGHLRGVLTCSSNIGAYQLFQGQLTNSEEMLQQTLTLSKRLKDPRAELDTLTALALLEQTRGNTQAARNHFNDGHKIIGSITDPDFRAIFKSEWSLYLLKENWVSEAQEALNEAWSELQSDELTEAKGLLLLVKSELEVLNENFDSARDLAEEALSIFQKTGPGIQNAITHRLLAKIFRDSGPDWADRAETHFDLAYVTFEEMGARLELAETMVEMTRFWMYLEEFEEAEAQLEEAINIFQESGAHQRIQQLEKEEDLPWQ